MKGQIYVFIILLLMTFTSCRQENGFKVGFLLPNLTDARYPKDRDYFSAKIKEAGGVAEIGDAQNDSKVQEEQARQMIDGGVKVLVITAVNQYTAASIVRDAHDKGIKVIAYERIIQNCDVDYMVTFDHYLVGKQQANYAISKVPQGNYVLIGGDKSDKNAELLKKGQLEILDPVVKTGKIKILFNAFIENWDRDNAYMEMKKILSLSGEKIDVVISSNDGMAGGIIRALDENQKDHVTLITGLDADLNACQRIVKGKQTMTVYKPFKKQAEYAADLAIRLIEGKNVENVNAKTFNGAINVPTISMESIVVDNGNIKSTIIADGFYSEADIMK